MTTVTSSDEAVLRPPALPHRWTRARVAGYFLVGLWLAFFIGLAIYLYGAWNIGLIETYGPKYWSGLKTTLTLVAISFLLGMIISIPVAIAGLSKNRFARRLSGGYVYFFRGTPLLAQVFLIYYGLGSFRPQLQDLGLWGFFRDAWSCAILAFTLNTAAYQAVILRGAIKSVSTGQWEAASALGLSKRVTFWKIILPQALIVALRPYGNELILLLKGSAIVAIITIYDLMGETRRAYAQTFDFQTYLWAAVIYFVIVELIRNLWDWIERRLTRHLIR
ncbi:ABC transporter permease [Phyllobacterium leguminum]|uniref:Amino acid ABC transporter membrane protein 2 (PAAT family) n=1 Tax=Phyllobacterium leguminum TaxID=314237 RepID=A0A318T7C1_9HYPH|nr:ABC transporter permease [Phyllobacterium leguminum]PYE88283.1 amino acid ABC transporter membrane protein 2 (PAAT family) [Phyllobacterium leguminum]